MSMPRCLRASRLRLWALATVAFTAACASSSTQGPGPAGTPIAGVVGEKALDADASKLFLSRPGPKTEIRIQPPEAAGFTFVVDSVEPAGKGTALIGHVKDAPGSSGTVVILESAIAGSIRIPGRDVYVLGSSSRGDGKRVVRAVDPAKLPPDHPPGYGSVRGEGPRRPPQPVGNVGDTCSTDDPTRITVMILYTPAARTQAGGTLPMEASIYAAIAEANQSFVNSDINTQFELVHVAEINYTSAGDYLADVCHLHDPADGVMDNVQGLRNTYRADLVALVVPDASSCGITYGQLVDTTVSCTTATNHDVVGAPGNVHEEGAYHVLALGCIQTNFTLPHEFGHSGSARHNWGCDSTDNSPTHSNHGFFFDSGTTATSWRTILSYPLSSGCGTRGNRVPHFSNPAINFNGNPTGISTGTQPADNHNVLNTTRAILANYRCSMAPPSKVWMKDTWGDTGAEPDADPDIMYASPYVWTRQSQDALAAGFTDRYQHEHQHQNPVLHQPTWTYVKLHNNGAGSANGHVKVYYANASTSLSWPAAWTLIGDVNVPAFAAGSTKVVEIPWADPPGTGHYCLTARWESTADPITGETSDIGANTRNSNKVIWRNLEILATPGGDADSSFLARAMAGDVFFLEFVTPGPRPFLPVGELSVTLDLAGGRLESKALEGVSQTGPNQFRVRASGGRIQVAMTAHERTPDAVVKVRFHRPKEQDRRTYRILINQLESRKTGTPPERVGGMAYELEP